MEQIEAELEAGAWKVITEARETGTAGIFRPDGEVRMGLIDEIVHAVDVEQVLFEAPRKEQQVWFLRASAAKSTSATSRPTTCSRWRRCAWGCAPTPWSSA